jgi:hypothetical protein
MLSQLANKDSTASIGVIIDELRGFLLEKRYGYIKKVVINLFLGVFV